jgi:RNA polymerase sigma-70 factor (ECF subfamily)
VRKNLLPDDKLNRFERLILPHLGAAYNLARHLTGNDQDAQDVVQEAYIRAFKAFDSFSNVNSAGWILTIVRNTCYTRLKRNQSAQPMESFNEDLHMNAAVPLGSATGFKQPTPEELVITDANQKIVRQAVAALPIGYREVIILREFEGLSYREIGKIVGIPIGTVMSRLARARKHLQHSLAGIDHKVG